MRFFHFTEMPYPFIPDDYYERYGSARVILPNGLLDRRKAHDLYNAYLDQHEYADQLGYNIFLNEHHQTVTCTNSAVSVSAGALARRTRQARILILGYPLGNRDEPLRVAEEVAMLDSISGGRIECGFVRGVPMETHPSNANPAFNRERFTEAHDLIVKAWTTPDPFAWEGTHYQYRYVNVWPQPYQQPHPPIWVSGTGSMETVDWAADKGYTFAVFQTPWDVAVQLFDRYRARRAAAGLPAPGPATFAYLLGLFVGESDEAAQRDGRGLEWYFRTREPAGFRFVPGHSSAEAIAAGWSGGRHGRSWQELQDAGIVILGSPTTVIKRLRDLHARTGVGNVLMMMHAGAMSNDVVMRSQKLFATEVMPALADLS